MAEFLQVEMEGESFFKSLEDEITYLFAKLSDLIDKKRKNILKTLKEIHQEYQRREESRLMKLTAYSDFKSRLTKTDTKLNEILEIRDDSVQNVDNQISKLINPTKCPKVFFQQDQLDSIIAKFDTIQLITSDKETNFDLESSFEQFLTDNLSKLPEDPELVSQRNTSFIRHMTLHKRQSTLSARPITDIKIVSNKSQIPVGYSALDSTADGKEIQLWDAFKFRVFTVRPKRYLCYTRQTMDAVSIKEGTTKRSRHEIPESDEIVVTDIRLMSASTSEFIPLDYEVVERTVDQNEPSLNKHILLVKYEKKLATVQAVLQIMFLEESKKDEYLPPKFHSVSVPVNGYYICFNSDIFKTSRETREQLTKSLPEGVNM